MCLICANTHTHTSEYTDAQQTVIMPCAGCKGRSDEWDEVSALSESMKWQLWEVHNFICCEKCNRLKFYKFQIRVWINEIPKNLPMLYFLGSFHENNEIFYPQNGPKRLAEWTPPLSGGAAAWVCDDCLGSMSWWRSWSKTLVCRLAVGFSSSWCLHIYGNLEKSFLVCTQAGPCLVSFGPRLGMKVEGKWGRSLVFLFRLDCQHFSVSFHLSSHQQEPTQRPVYMLPGCLI